MRVIFLDSTDPARNLATEEYLLKHTTGNIFMLWRNEPSIIVGRNQNTLAEINLDYVNEHSIKVIRRLTGGGAVFHDLGNLNYTFIEENSTEKFGDYEIFSRPIIATLKSLGVNAELKGRNDLCIDSLKFSGNAQVAWHNRVMHHGTLLFSANVSNMSDALKVNELKIKSKGIKSVRSHVTNISDHLKTPMTVTQFRDEIAKAVTTTFDDCQVLPLTDEENAFIDKLVEDKYGTWEWNFGYNKKYSFFKEVRFNCGLLQVNMNIDNNIITDIRIEGDYFGRCEVEDFENFMKGTPYNPEAVRAHIDEINIDDYFSGTDTQQFLTAMF